MDIEIKNQQSDFLFYRSSDGKITVRVIAGDETVWMTQRSMGELFAVDIRTISEHIQNILKTNELQENSVIRKIRITADDGKDYLTNFYSLDMIIAVGYRVNSYNATQFRIWATKILKEYLIKGFAMDDERLKQSKILFGKDYFDELLERIREIRASERRFYQKITDIYATSVDYDSKAPITQTFFSTVQNKLEYAITHMTAGEIIRSRANSEKPHMGLTTWSNQKDGGKILKTDVRVAKNYFTEKEIRELNRVVNMYLEYAELQAERQRAMSMSDWVKKLDAFLSFNDYDILKNAGTIRKTVADAFAEEQYQKFRLIQDKEYKSDFDKMVEGAKNKQLPKEGDVIYAQKVKTEPASNFNTALKGMLSVPPMKKEDETNEGAE
ncbi:MAG: virulence RhuM family protein [Bacteroidia bacterium]|jgi:hypothetical protein|nr:virulence RhuM family protein [Bacteroidia bacterium]